SQVKSSKLLTAKRSAEDAFGNGEEDAGPRKRRQSRFSGDPGSDLDVKSMLASTMREIGERKRMTLSTLPSPAPSLFPSPPSPPVPISSFPGVDSAIEKARKAAELQSRIQAQLVAKPNLLAGPGSIAGMDMGARAMIPTKPMPLILDEEGRAVDTAGKTVQPLIRQPTIKANIRAQQRASFKRITEQVKRKKPLEKAEESVYFDPRVKQEMTARSRRTFKFNEPGKFIKQGQMVRAKAQLDQLQTEIASVARKTGISSATKLALLAHQRETVDSEIPDVEWWDQDILSTKSYHTKMPGLHSECYRGITRLIEHPVMIKPPGELSRPVQVPIMLTKRERKKLRKQRRREAEKEKQEKIQFGLIEKPEPKVRISNLMRVLGSEAVLEPSKVEAHVRAQMAERQRNHEKANEARKLTPAQKKAKTLRKLKEDLSCGVHVTVYRVHDLSNQAIRFKVDMNAQQLHLSGRLLLFRDINIVIVEGGPKGLKKFKKLMMHRIKWDPEKKGEDEDSDSDAETSRRQKSSKCSIVWEGKMEKKCFGDWKVKGIPTEVLAREHLRRFGVEHYWDLALSETIIEQGKDE
ncbi:U4/U6 small nuclear ribonucleoprotein Prp3, partial [Geodia barretti]